VAENDAVRPINIKEAHDGTEERNNRKAKMEVFRKALANGCAESCSSSETVSDDPDNDQGADCSELDGVVKLEVGEDGEQGRHGQEEYFHALEK